MRFACALLAAMEALPTHAADSRMIWLSCRSTAYPDHAPTILAINLGETPQVTVYNAKEKRLDPFLKEYPSTSKLLSNTVRLGTNRTIYVYQKFVSNDIGRNSDGYPTVLKSEYSISIDGVTGAYLETELFFTANADNLSEIGTAENEIHREMHCVSSSPKDVPAPLF